MQRFSRIRTVVNKFCDYLAQVESLNGYTANDKIVKAKEMYLEFETKSNVGNKNVPKAPVFAFEHCWNALKYDQKWPETSTFKKHARTEVPKTSFNDPVHVHINLDGEDTSSIPRTDERLVGRKLAKEGRTKSKGKFVYDSSAIIQKIDQPVVMNEKIHDDDDAMLKENDRKMDEYLGLERENLDLKKMKFSMEKQMFDMDIALKEAEFMKVNISSLKDANQIEFYQSMKKNIKARYQTKQ